VSKKGHIGGGFLSEMIPLITFDNVSPFWLEAQQRFHFLNHKCLASNGDTIRPLTLTLSRVYIRVASSRLVLLAFVADDLVGPVRIQDLHDDRGAVAAKGGAQSRMKLLKGDV
jgi:hypothetical protein